MAAAAAAGDKTAAAGGGERLTAEQLKMLQVHIGSKASILCHAYATLLLPHKTGWEPSATKGACLLVIDRSREHKPKRIQIHDLHNYEARARVSASCAPARGVCCAVAAVPPLTARLPHFDTQCKFELELFPGMMYVADKPTVHLLQTQTGDNRALGFGDDESGREFANKVLSMMPQPPPATEEKKPGLLQRMFSSKKPERQISLPSNFVHVAHIGYNDQGGFDLSNLPREWKDIFKAAGVKRSELRNPETARLIFDVAAREMSDLLPAVAPRPDLVPPAPPVAAADPATRQARAATVSGVPSAPSAAGGPPPPPPLAPPPPPLMAAAVPAAPPTHQRSPSQDSNSSARDRSQTTLATSTSPPGGSLLDQIRSGVKLRRVNSDASAAAGLPSPDKLAAAGPAAAPAALPEAPKPNTEKRQSMISSLKAALEIRRRALEMSRAEEERQGRPTKAEAEEEADDWD